MVILLLFAFLSGLVTIAAPCIWPLLPIILSSTATGGKHKPLGITLGIIISFAVFTLTISYVVKIIPFDPGFLRLFAVVVIGFLGLTLVIPRLSRILEGYVSRISGKFAGITSRNRPGFLGCLITGIALGFVWTPCAGPILATIATLAATTAVNFQIILVTASYVAGIGLTLFIFATLGNRVFTKSKLFSKYTGRLQQLFGVIMILTALAIFTNYDKVLQLKLLDLFPSYSNFLLILEDNPLVKKQLDSIRGGKQIADQKIDMPLAQLQLLRDYGPAQDFAGITHWLNSSPLTIQSLQGKVVLVDFWTYTCINCIRTLPYVTSWYEKYKDKGFVVVGVHTPEFEFEKNTQNVANALKQYKINYPVAQDNDYATWNAYSNHYWPAKYLIDAKGEIRYVHFGEGEYENTEKAIQLLLQERGVSVGQGFTSTTTPSFRDNQTPETYLGLMRLDKSLFGDNEELKTGVQTFTSVYGPPENGFYYTGTWDLQDEYASSVKGAGIDLNFNANKVFLVITPKSPQDKIKVFLDGALIDAARAGTDVKNGYVILDDARLYNLVRIGDDHKSHLLKLEFQTPGTKVFAFTFG